MLRFLNLNKSPGFTSHDCVAKVRRLLHMKQVGHGGTLDPDATGVLPIALGRATRLLQFLPTDKAYHGTIKLGITTTTDDLAGEVISRNPVDSTQIDLATISQALLQFHGKIDQIPPKYSAIQVEGKRLYDLARSNIDIDIPVRQVEIFEIKILAWRSGEFPELDVEIACGAGTYIRSIARDLGAVLGTGGTLAALIRTRSAGFSLDTSITLDQLATLLEKQPETQLTTWQPISPQVALRHLPQVILPAPLAKRWTQGQKIPHVPIINLSGEFIRVAGEDGNLLGISQVLGNPLMNPEELSPESVVLVPKVVLEPGTKN
jgi:tRNA pseudouridine55 synthase